MTPQQEIIAALNVKPTINVDEEIRTRVDFLKDYLLKTGLRGYVLGISGGQDSTLAGKLAQMAVYELNMAENCTLRGRQWFFYAVRLPYGIQRDEDDASLALDWINPTEAKRVNIEDAVDASYWSLAHDGRIELSDFLKGNIKARERMKVQYDIAGHYGLAVIGTDHAAEAVMGFYTKHGDGACDVTPLAGLNKRQGRAMLVALGCPERLYMKAPTADLEDDKPGLADEDAHGVSYAFIDDYLEGKEVHPSAKRIIENAYRKTEHKRRLPVTPYCEWWKQ